MPRKPTNVSYKPSLREIRERLHRIDTRIARHKEYQAAVKAGLKPKRPRGRPKTEPQPSQYTEAEQRVIVGLLADIAQKIKGRRRVRVVVYRLLRDRCAARYLQIKATFIRLRKGFDYPERITPQQYAAFRVYDEAKGCVEVLHYDGVECYPPHKWYPGVRRAPKLTNTQRSKRETQHRYLKSLGIKVPYQWRTRRKSIHEIAKSTLYRWRQKERAALGLPPRPRGGPRIDNPKPSTIARRDRRLRQKLGLTKPRGHHERKWIENPKPATIVARKYYAATTARRRAQAAAKKAFPPQKVA
jgi:hypothetical protein